MQNECISSYLFLSRRLRLFEILQGSFPISLSQRLNRYEPLNHCSINVKYRLGVGSSVLTLLRRTRTRCQKELHIFPDVRQTKVRQTEIRRAQLQMGRNLAVAECIVIVHDHGGRLSCYHNIMLGSCQTSRKAIQ